MKKLLLITFIFLTLSFTKDSNNIKNTINNNISNQSQDCTFGYSININYDYNIDPTHVTFDWNFNESPIPFNSRARIEILDDGIIQCNSQLFDLSYNISPFINPVSSLTIDLDNLDGLGTSTKCFIWRLVITGQLNDNGTLIRCETTTDWEYFATS